MTARVGKSEHVRSMFGQIADRYDLLNQILSLGRHSAWRRRAAAVAADSDPTLVLDVCAGTGDMSLEVLRLCRKDATVVAADFCEPMLRLASAKFGRQGAVVPLVAADATRLPFRDCSFDVVTVAFGLRNLDNVPKGIAEISRVLRPGGRLVCLEFCVPRGRLARFLVSLHEKHVLPFVGGLLSRRDAYEYLPASIEAFVSAEALWRMMVLAGIEPAPSLAMNLGSVCIHIGDKA